MRGIELEDHARRAVELSTNRLRRRELRDNRARREAIDIRAGHQRGELLPTFGTDKASCLPCQTDQH